MLNVFEPCTLQLGDRNYYVLGENDVVLSKDEWLKLVAGELTADSSCSLLRPAKSKSE